MLQHGGKRKRKGRKTELRRETTRKSDGGFEKCRGRPTGNKRMREWGMYLKSTIEIQDPYAKSAAARRGGERELKIGNRERRVEILYIE